MIYDEIIHCLNQHGAGLTLTELTSGVNRPADEIAPALLELQNRGEVILTRKGRFATPASLGLIPARVFMLKSGVPLAKPLDGGEEMRILRRGDVRGMHGDLVLVKEEKHRKGYSARCVLEQVIERAHKTLTGVLTERMEVEEQPAILVRRGKHRRKVAQEAVVRRVYTVEPYDVHTVCRIELTGDLMGAKPGDAVVMEILEYPRHQVPLKGRIIEKLGSGGDVTVQLNALLSEHGIRREFPREAEELAASLPLQVSEADRAGRFDARGITLFTIDGEDAQDFDDAVSLEKTEDGCWMLGVHIADVSHYVREGDAIDQEALLRGTSVYLPGLTVPMLPEALCNNLCSLMPDMDRLAMSMMMKIRDGKVVEHGLSPSVIHSSARLTYTQVNRMLAGEGEAVPRALHETLWNMIDLSRTLRRVRTERGSIDFDLAEPAFRLDEKGDPLDVFARERGEAERMIEDFMLLANETVARMAKQNGIPFLYRIHEDPDPEKLLNLKLFLSTQHFTAHLSEHPSPKEIQMLLDTTKDLPEAGVIKHVTLRALKKACYSEKPVGHFGLAAEDYCHFTSPIRRYPDLTVHRMLKLMVRGETEQAARRRRDMPSLAVQCSQREAEAAAVERDADDLMRARYMQSHIGEVFEGVVSGLNSWGLYVTLPSTVEGLIHLRDLPEYYEFDEVRQMFIGERRGHLIRLGDPMRVKVDSVDVMAGEVNFLPAGKRD